MSETPAPSPQARREGPEGGGPNLGRRAVLALVGVAVVVGAIVIGSSALPRWWAQRVGDQVDGDLSTGLWVGFMYGLVGTVLPLLVLALVFRFFRRRWIVWAVGVGVALVLAGPNLLTLGIVLGSGSAAHAADRTLDVEAPWFRGGMLVGVLVGLAATAFLLYAAVSRRRARADARRMRDELKAASSESPPPGRSSGSESDL